MIYVYFHRFLCGITVSALIIIESVCSLPEVPSLSETAFIHVDLPRDDENVQRQLVDAIHEYGRVLTHVPVQIVDISERPAALLIKWAEVCVISTFQVPVIWQGFANILCIQNCNVSLLVFCVHSQIFLRFD